MNPSRTQNRGEKGLSAGGGVEVDGGDEAVASVGIGLETSRGDQGAEATAGGGGHCYSEVRAALAPHPYSFTTSSFL